MKYVSFLTIIIASSVSLALNANRTIVLTGGAGVGKSTVIKELAKQGYQVVPETFTVLFSRAEQEGTMDTFFADPLKLRYDLMAEQLQAESRVDHTQPAFLDRSAVDIIVFGDHFNVAMPDDLRNQANQKHDLIFFLDPLPAEYFENTAIRRESPKESAAVHTLLKNAYKAQGYHAYQLIDVPFGTPEERAQFILNKTNQTFFFANVIDCFARKNSLYLVQDFMGPVKLIQFQGKEGQKYNFFGIEQDKQPRVDFKEFKKSVAALMGVQPDKMLEIIGDSAQFSAQGSNYVRKLLREHFAARRLLEYGYTGYIKGEQLDINSFLNEYLDENPTEAHKVLANVLGHTHVALHQWGTRGSEHVSNYVVVYSQDGMSKAPVYNENGIKTSGFTTFGDDIVISDHILQSKDGDRVVCVEGGVQSFRQVMNALSLDVPVDFIYNVRTPEREPFFSAARFISKVREAFVDEKAPTAEFVQKIYDDYSATLKSIWDTSKGDYLTKKALFDTAIHDFIHLGMYKKVNKLCTFDNANLGALK